jgi:hypothetical protein
MPLHNNCTCTVEPVMSRIPRGDRITVGSVVDDAVIREHGELGPMVADANYDFNSLSGADERTYQAYVHDAA